MVIDCINGVMVSMLVRNVVDLRFESRSIITKSYQIGICCFSANHTTLRRKNKYWMSEYQDNVSKWSDMSTYRLHVSVSQHYKNRTNRVDLLQSGHHHLFEKITCTCHKIKQQSLTYSNGKYELCGENLLIHLWKFF